MQRLRMPLAEAYSCLGSCRRLFTCEKGMIVEAPLLILMGADIKQVCFDRPINEVSSKIKENHTYHGDAYDPHQLLPWVSN